MTHPFFCLTFLFFMIATSQSKASSDNEHPFNRAQSVINTFEVMCTLELPNFERIDAKATAMRMQLLSDNKSPSPEGTVRHGKTWEGVLTTGPFLLFLDEMSGPKGTSTSCAIVGDVPDVDAFRTEAVNQMKLQNIPTPEIGGGASRSFIWYGIYGPGTTLILRDFKPSGKPGVMLKLLTMSPRR